MDNKDVGSRGNKNNPPLPQLPVQIQCIKCIYVKHFSFFLYLYVGVSTQVCTGAVVKQIHKDKHQAGALIMVPASAQLTLTPGQEKEDTKSREQAAKAEIDGTGKKIY